MMHKTIVDLKNHMNKIIPKMKHLDDLYYEGTAVSYENYIKLLKDDILDFRDYFEVYISAISSNEGYDPHVRKVCYMISDFDRVLWEIKQASCLSDYSEIAEAWHEFETNYLS